MEEIKAEDIMLGNWFIGYDDKPFKWNLAHFGLLTLDGPTIDEIIKAPIPLTEDILLKCGASIITIDNKNSYTPNGYVGRVFKIGEFKCYVDREHNRWAYRATMIKDVEFLHTFQNLFKSLTGNDLKIQV